MSKLQIKIEADTPNPDRPSYEFGDKIADATITLPDTLTPDVVRLLAARAVAFLHGEIGKAYAHAERTGGIAMLRDILDTNRPSQASLGEPVHDPAARDVDEDIEAPKDKVFIGGDPLPDEAVAAGHPDK